MHALPRDQVSAPRNMGNFIILLSWVFSSSNPETIVNIIIIPQTHNDVYHP